jgi:hypothetical protein
LMAGALGFQAVGGLMSAAAADEINQHQAFWIPMLAWSVSVLGFAIGFLLLCIKRREPIQPPQHNAGNRPSSEDSPASETSSSLGPRG